MSRAPALALLLVLSLGAIAALYGRTLDYGLVWMDEREIGEGEIVLGPGESWTAAFTRTLHKSEAGVQGSNPYYRPLQILVVTAIHRIAGPMPRAYRLLSLALAAATCFAFGALALLLFERTDLALLATALAALHPVGLESWVWISGIGEALSAFFTIASIGFGLLFVQMRGPRAIACAALSIAAFGIALLAKEKGIAAPVLLAAALAALHFGRGAALHGLAGPRALQRGAALAAIEGVLALAYLFVWRPALLGSGLLAAPPIGGSRTAHLLSALASWPAALLWLVAPLHSSTSDVVRIVTSPAAPMPWLGAALAVGSLLACVWLARRERPVAALGLAWIWIAFLPSANLFPQIHARAERYLFLSSFGAALLVVDLADWLFSRAAPPWRRVGPVMSVAALAIALAGRTWIRTPDWRSTSSLFEVDVARDPAFREGRFHLASALFREQKYAQADEQLRELLLLEQAPRPTWDYLNEVGLYQLACANDIALHRELDVVRDAERLSRAHPSIASAPPVRACLAQAQEALGRNAEAAATYEAVVAALPGDPPAAVSLAMARVYAKLGRRDEARRWLATATRDGPREPAFDYQLRSVERLLP